VGVDGQAQTTSAEKTVCSSPRIFLSYGREDTKDVAGRLYDPLAAPVGDNRVFTDIDAIDPGLVFEEAIVQALDSCDAVVALIGLRWLTVTDAAPRRGEPRGLRQARAGSCA